MRVPAFVLGVASMVGWVGLALGQTAAKARLDVTADSAGAAIQSTDMLADGQTRDLLRNGFPARMHFRTELWSTGGLFNHLVRAQEWDVVVRYDPLAKTFRAARIINGSVQVMGNFETYPALAAALAAPFELSVRPTRRGRYYYSTRLDIEMLSMSDLDEVERWLRGELGPAVHGKRGAGTAVGSGLRTLLLRLIGGERRHYEAQSKTFRLTVTPSS